MLAHLFWGRDHTNSAEKHVIVSLAVIFFSETWGGGGTYCVTSGLGLVLHSMGQEIQIEKKKAPYRKDRSRQ